MENNLQLERKTSKVVMEVSLPMVTGQQMEMVEEGTFFERNSQDFGSFPLSNVEIIVSLKSIIMGMSVFSVECAVSLTRDGHEKNACCSVYKL